MTLEPGEQSVLGVTQRGLSYARQRAASSNLTPALSPLKFYAYILVVLALSIFYTNN